MWLWLALAVLMAATAFAVMWPLLGGVARATLADRSGAMDLAVYKDQLAEIEADVANGALAPKDADAARIEVSRRMLSYADRSSHAPIAPAPAARFGAAAVALALPLIVLPLYLFLGAPGMPSQLAAGREAATAVPANAGQATVADLIAKVEARLLAQPDEGQGWDVIAPVYMKQQRYDDASAAYRRAILLLGETPARLSGLAEASIRASNGKVTDEARDAFEKVVKLEPQQLEPRFWLALRREQDGELAPAAEDYRSLLAAASADAPWQAVVKERLAAVEARLAQKPGSQPSPEAVAAAEKMPAADRDRMIQGMVDGLHARLKQDGRDAAGWQRLLRAYVVLGNRPKANAALAEARQALAGDQAALGDLEAVARDMGLGS